MANSSGSSLFNRIKSIVPNLTGKAQASVKQQLHAGTTPQNSGTDQGAQSVIDEADSLLEADPPTGQWIVIAFVILVLGTALAYGIWLWLKPGDFMPSSNYATYAGLFIMALAIERILEPFSGLFIPSTKAKKVRSRATAAHAKRALAAVTGPHAAGALPVGQAPQAAAAPQAAPAAPQAAPAAPQAALAAPQAALAAQQETLAAQQETLAAQQETAARQAAAARQEAAAAQKAAAVAQTELHHSQGARAVLMWATASVLAMLVCASLGVFLLRSVEAPTPTTAKAAAASVPSKAKDPNRLLDIFVTGLVVGAGTKPLHDLITQVQTTSGTSKAKASSPTTTS
jgi:hypothetical protein